MPQYKTKPCSCGGDLRATVFSNLESATLRRLDRQPPILPYQHAIIIGMKIVGFLSGRVYTCSKCGRITVGW